MAEKRARKTKASDIPLLEWVVGALGALIVAAEVTIEGVLHVAAPSRSGAR